MNCELVPFEGKFKCKYCNFTCKSGAVKRNCPLQKQPEPPPIEDVEAPGPLKRGLNFGKAIVKHVASGMRHCTPAQKNYRYTICSSNKCKLFLKHQGGGVCAHDSCGCYIRSNGKFMDKLSWAESRCPVGQWGPIDEITDQDTEKGV